LTSTSLSTGDLPVDTSTKSADAMGPVVDASEPGCDRGSAYAVLSRQIRAAKLLQRRRGSYAARITVTGLALAATWGAVLLVGDSWYQLIVAGVLGVVFTQVAFLGHDGGHQQVASRRLSNDTIGLVAGNLLTGLSIGWWVDKHNRHHANPNKENHDPDIGDGVLTFTTNQVASRTGRLGKLILRYQAFLFFPLLTLEGLHLHIASVRWLAGNRAKPHRAVELGFMALHAAAYFGILLTVLSPITALSFVAVHQAVFGLYMGCSFAPNHKGMRIVAAEEKLDFLQRQVLTSRNVRGGWLTDTVLGGLNYQIEHHLFPNMPRPSLRKAQRLVQQYCLEHEIAYTETSLVGSYAMALGHLHQLGSPLRAAVATGSS
jgi:fatty acid desaturase